jgi:aldehyde:ferredoxin oxidoreductase
MPAYDPRSIKGLGVTYATSPMGADHTAGTTVRAKLRHTEKEGQARASRDAQLGVTMLDSLGLCMMLGMALKDRSVLAGLVSDRFGIETTLEELMGIAGETLSLEREFNRRAGITGVQDRLPEFFYHEVNPASGAVFDIYDEELYP